MISFEEYRNGGSSTGFAPGVVSQHAAAPDVSMMSHRDVNEIPALGIKTTIVGIPMNVIPGYYLAGQSA